MIALLLYPGPYAKMVKHNNVLPNAHFKKKWGKFVRTWFNQPARKIRRRQGMCQTANIRSSNKLDAQV